MPGFCRETYAKIYARKRMQKYTPGFYALFCINIHLHIYALFCIKIKLDKIVILARARQCKVNILWELGVQIKL
jgi:hypothetical protein